MYGYEKEKPYLKIQDVLSRVDQRKVFQHLLGFLPTDGVKIRSPFRQDRYGGAYFDTYEGQLKFVDFADPRRVIRDCVDAVRELKRLSLNDALNYINDVFALGIGESSMLPVINPPPLSPKKESMPMDYYPRDFEGRDKAYWYDRYGITRGQLIDDGVFALKWFKVYSWRRKEYVTIRPFDLCYGYTDFAPGKLKAYTPFGGKREKWITNCDADDVGGINRLPLMGDTLILSKGYKDNRVLLNHSVPYSVWLQNEGMLPNGAILEDLAFRFTNIVILFDNDETGLRASEKLRDEINRIAISKASSIWLPPSYGEDIKDPSDLKHKKGSEELSSFLSINGLINGNGDGNKESFRENPPFLDATSEAPFELS